VPWEEIEKMSLCSPLWGDDRDSDISEPDSGDRVTIFTNELSPTPSELYCLQQVQPLPSPLLDCAAHAGCPGDSSPARASCKAQLQLHHLQEPGCAGGCWLWFRGWWLELSESVLGLHVRHGAHGIGRSAMW
jgi:hypothetical protein